MQRKTILNREEKYKSFVNGRLSWDSDGGRIRLPIGIRPQGRSRPMCDGCGQRCSVADDQGLQEFESLPSWCLVVFFVNQTRGPRPDNP